MIMEYSYLLLVPLLSQLTLGALRRHSARSAILLQDLSRSSNEEVWLSKQMLYLAAQTSTCTVVQHQVMCVGTVVTTSDPQGTGTVVRAMTSSGSLCSLQSYFRSV